MKHIQKRQITVLLSFFVLSQTTFAGTPFQIINRQSSLNSANPAELLILNSLNATADSLQQVVNEGFLSDNNRSIFSKGMAQANASNVTSAIFGRYDSTPKYHLGVGIQGGMYSESGQTTTTANNELPSLGAAGQAIISLGVRGDVLGLSKLGGLEGHRMMFYLSGMGYSLDVSDVKFSLFNIGLNAQYKVLTPVGSRYVAQWGGLDFGTGLNFFTNSASYSATLQQSAQTAVAGGAGSTTINSNIAYELGVESTTFLVPVEVATSFRFLYLFTLYMGAGADFNFGSSHLTGSASGPITATTTAAVSTATLFSGDASLSLDDGQSSSPSLVTGRGFIGAQAELFGLQLGMDYTRRTSGAYSIGGGVRFAF